MENPSRSYTILKLKTKGATRLAQRFRQWPRAAAYEEKDFSCARKYAPSIVYFLFVYEVGVGPTGEPRSTHHPRNPLNGDIHLCWKAIGYAEGSEGK